MYKVVELALGEEIELVNQVFSNPAGEKLLVLWDETYNDRSSYEPGRPVEDCIYYEGQRSFLLAVKQMMEMKK